MDGLRIAASFCSFLSLLLLIVGMASDYWITFGTDSVGLWRLCSGICLSFSMDVDAYIHATRAFLLMGMFAGAASFFSLCASFYRPKIGSISTAVLAVLASIAAGVCSLIAMASFTGVSVARYMGPGENFGWSFGLGWASFPLFLITGGLAYMLVHRTTEE
uniref:lens fiber membrane intrinsic protein-like n=1 Tax=Euleptes europaea TaxID=460621 RepID=UPI00253F97F6|nr:lens fiber membrane intrinsic protein-like [Euleptes europaea]